MSAHDVVETAPEFETANDRFKHSFANWFWSSMIAATVAHFMIFAFWPTMTAEDVTFSMDDMEAIDLPPEIEIPPPPQQIARPATPVISDTQIDEDITIAPTTFEDNPVEDLPPPPTAATNVASSGPVFTPMEVKPKLLNRAKVQQQIRLNYPPLLEQANIGGDVMVWFYIDETGKVIDSQIQESSGHPQLDEAALKVAPMMEFAPAQNRDKNIAVWIALAVTFNVRD